MEMAAVSFVSTRPLGEMAGAGGCGGRGGDNAPMAHGSAGGGFHLGGSAQGVRSHVAPMHSGLSCDIPAGITMALMQVHGGGPGHAFVHGGRCALPLSARPIHG